MPFLKCDCCGTVVLILAADDDGAYCEVDEADRLTPETVILAKHVDFPDEITDCSIMQVAWIEAKWKEIIEVDELIGSEGETYYLFPRKFFKPISFHGIYEHRNRPNN